MTAHKTETSIEFADALGRRTRMGSWEDQTISTYRKIAEAVREGWWDHAADLADFFVDEAQVCFSIYRQWLFDLRGFLADKGMSEEELARVDSEILAKLALPDGTPFNSHRRWNDFRNEQRGLLRHLHREEAAEALESLDRMKETWRQTHDRDVDHTYGLMSVVQELYGSDGIAEMYNRVLLPLFAWRYNKFDIDSHPWDEALETMLTVSCEAMRGHLVGPGRTGDMELIETDESYILSFDPCGSGQRTIRGDWIEDTPARMEEPYNWGVSTEEASWNHYTKGVCLYCAHCIVLNEEFAIDRFGYPVRVIDPPIYPDTNRDPNVRQKCRWTMYKDPTKVPVEFYERVGRKKPDVFGSTHFEAPELPDSGSLGMPGTG